MAITISSISAYSRFPKKMAWDFSFKPLNKVLCLRGFLCHFSGAAISVFAWKSSAAPQKNTTTAINLFGCLSESAAKERKDACSLYTQAEQRLSCQSGFWLLWMAVFLRKRLYQPVMQHHKIIVDANLYHYVS